MDTGHTTAMGLGYGLACRDAELALAGCRDYARGRATEDTARDKIGKLRAALLEMERALDLMDAAVTEREALLACWRSGQISPAQWVQHLADDPALGAENV